MSGKTFVLVPGAGGDPWYWHRVAPLLAARGHEVIAVALPAADDAAGLREYADAVVRAIGDRSRPDIVLVAQSMAGFTAPLVGERVPVRCLVLLNAMIPLPGETPGEWFARTGQHEARREQAARDGRDPDAPFDALVDLFHDVPKSVTDEAWARGEPRQSDHVFGSRCHFSRWPEVPAHVLVASEDRLFPASFQQRVARERLGAPSYLLPGGHLVALSRPEELAARLLAIADAA